MNNKGHIGIITIITASLMIGFLWVNIHKFQHKSKMVSNKAINTMDTKCSDAFNDLYKFKQSSNINTDNSTDKIDDKKYLKNNVNSIFHKDNRELYFNGSTYIQIDALKNVLLKDTFTVEFWVQNNGGDYRGLISNEYGYNPGFDYRFGREANGRKLHMMTNTVSGNNYTSVNIDLNTYTHMAFVYNGKSFKIYQNGVLIGKNKITGDMPIVNNAVIIGCNNNKREFFKGKMDDFRIWTIARSSDEIRNNFDKELMGNEKGLLVYYKLNEQSGNIAHDSSPNKLTGVIHNPTWNKRNN